MIRWLLSTLLGLGLVGCASTNNTTSDVAWYTEQGIGQAELLFAARPIGPILEDPAVDDEVRRRLGIAAAARDFGRRRLGLADNGQYEDVVFLDAPAVVYVVGAAPQDGLEPYLWRYPVVGALPYRGHFALDDAEAEASALEASGLDVSVRPVSTYSLLGIAPDPIVSTMLFRRDELDVVETVLHELAHATVFAPGAGAFNEGLATFIGREGRRQFVQERFGQGSAVAVRAAADDADSDTWNRAVAALAFDLRVLYSQRGSRTRSALLDEKQRIFERHQRHWIDEVAGTLFSVRLRSAQLPDNNAALAAVGIYSLKQHLYERAFEGCSRDWRCFLGLLREVASDDDPEVRLAERAASTAPRDRELP